MSVCKRLTNTEQASSTSYWAWQVNVSQHDGTVPDRIDVPDNLSMYTVMHTPTSLVHKSVMQCRLKLYVLVNLFSVVLKQGTADTLVLKYNC